MDKKKIGILTFHRAVNYGAILQGYALYRTLEEIGAQAVVVDYRNPKLEWRRKKIQYEKNNKLKSINHSLICMKSKMKKIRQFDDFNNKYLKLSKAYTAENIKEIVDEYDCFVTGSDQVFSPKCVDFDSIYFLSFAKAGQKYSYAASFGTNQIEDKFISQIKDRLKDFSKISVREESGSEILRDICGKESFVNIDPSLLLTAEQWEDISSDRLVEEKYVLIFRVNKPIQLLSYAINLAKEKNLKVVYITDIIKKREKNVIYVKSPSVEDFLSYIRNAEYVCTNSFHGTAFSLIFNKNVIVETNTQTGKNNRIKELFELLGIKNRDISEKLEIEEDICWRDVNKNIEENRVKAIDYLRSIVEE